MIRAVLDCNVVITSALSSGKCAELLSRARQRDGFELVWSPPIIAERLRVIEYPGSRRARRCATVLHDPVARPSNGDAILSWSP